MRLVIPVIRSPTKPPSSSQNRLATIPSPVPECPPPPKWKTKRVTSRPINTALHQAVLDERIKQVRLLVDRHGANINCIDVFGRTPLMLTCMLANDDVAYKMARIFLQRGATFNNRDVMGRTVLSYACMKGKAALVQRILAEDIYEVNEPDNDGCTPLHHAAVQGNATIVKQMVEKVLQYRLDVDRKDKLGYTAFLLACKHGWYGSALVLLEEGLASPCVRDNEFFYNAVEWVQASRPPCGDPHAQAFSQRSKTSPAFTNTALSFDRSSGNSCLYRRHRLPVGCKHTRSDPDPFTCRAINLPPTTDHQHHQYIIQQQLSLKQDLLLRIEQLFPSEKRPVTSTTRNNKPSTAKLLALRPDRGDLHAGSADIGKLFRIYANHYSQCHGSTRRRPITVSGGENVFRR